MKKEGIESTGIYMCPILRRKEVETQKGNMNHSNYNKEKKKRVKKQSRYRPGVAQRVPGS